MTEAEYKLIEASGHVAQATRALLVWLYDAENDSRCRCCKRENINEWAAHDPSMPCGELRDAVNGLSAAVRAVTVAK